MSHFSPNNGLTDQSGQQGPPRPPPFDMNAAPPRLSFVSRNDSYVPRPHQNNSPPLGGYFLSNLSPPPPPLRPLLPAPRLPSPPLLPYIPAVLPSQSHHISHTGYGTLPVSQISTYPSGPADVPNINWPRQNEAQRIISLGSVGKAYGEATVTNFEGYYPPLGLAMTQEQLGQVRPVIDKPELGAEELSQLERLIRTDPRPVLEDIISSSPNEPATLSNIYAELRKRFPQLRAIDKSSITQWKDDVVREHDKLKAVTSFSNNTEPSHRSSGKERVYQSLYENAGQESNYDWETILVGHHESDDNGCDEKEMAQHPSLQGLFEYVFNNGRNLPRVRGMPPLLSQAQLLGYEEIPPSTPKSPMVIDVYHPFGLVSQTHRSSTSVDDLTHASLSGKTLVTEVPPQKQKHAPLSMFASQPEREHDVMVSDI